SVTGVQTCALPIFTLTLAADTPSGKLTEAAPMFGKVPSSSGNVSPSSPENRISTEAHPIGLVSVPPTDHVMVLAPAERETSGAPGAGGGGEISTNGVACVATV